MTDLADAMVQHHDLSFSAAKKITGRVVTMAQQEKVSIHAIDVPLWPVRRRRRWGWSCI